MSTNMGTDPSRFGRTAERLIVGSKHRSTTQKAVRRLLYTLGGLIPVLILIALLMPSVQ